MDPDEYFAAFTNNFVEWIKDKKRYIQFVSESDFPCSNNIDSRFLVTAVYIPKEAKYATIDIGRGKNCSEFTWRETDMLPIEDVLITSLQIPKISDVNEFNPFSHLEVDMDKFKRIVPYYPFIYPFDHANKYTSTRMSVWFHSDDIQEYYIEYCFAPEDIPEKCYPSGIEDTRDITLGEIEMLDGRLECMLFNYDHKRCYSRAWN